MSQLKETCNLLDDTLIEYFETLESVHQKQEELENCMKEGFILMAKARYSMGNKSVGALQYDTENMEASSVVKLSDDDIYPVFSPQSEQAENDIKDGKPTEDGLRRRKQGNGDEKDVDEVTKCIEEIGFEDKKHKENPRSPRKDPLKWFGVLVPQALRDSQKKFKQAVNLSCDIATLKVKLNSLQSHYSQLMQEKKDILNSVSLFTD